MKQIFVELNGTVCGLSGEYNSIWNLNKYLNLNLIPSEHIEWILISSIPESLSFITKRICRKFNIVPDEIIACPKLGIVNWEYYSTWIYSLMTYVNKERETILITDNFNVTSILYGIEDLTIMNSKMAVKSNLMKLQIAPAIFRNGPYL